MNIANTLLDISSHLGYMNRREESLETIEEYAQLCRDLAAAGSAAFHPEFALSLNNLSIRLSDLGRQEEALQTIEESLQLYR